MNFSASISSPRLCFGFSELSRQLGVAVCSNDSENPLCNARRKLVRPLADRRVTYTKGLGSSGSRATKQF